MRWLRKLVVTGTICAIVLSSGTSCAKKPTMPYRGDYNATQAIKARDTEKYYAIREKITHRFSRIYYDLEFLLKDPNNALLREQIRKDEEWLKKQKGNKADFWHAYLLYATGRQDEALEKATKLNKKFGFVLDEWGVLTAFRLGNHYTWEKTNYLLGRIYADRNDWLKASPHLSAIQQKDHYDSDPRQNGARRTFSAKARELLKNHGILVVKPEYFSSPILKGITEKFNGRIIVPYNSRGNPCIFNIVYKNHEHAKDDFLRLKNEYALLAKKPSTTIFYSSPYAKGKGPIEKLLEEWGPRVRLGWVKEGDDYTFRVLGNPHGTLGWGHLEYDIHHEFYQTQRFLSFEKSPDVLQIYDFGLGYDLGNQRWHKPDSLLTQAIIHDVRTAPAFQITLMQGNNLEVTNCQRLLAERLYREAELIVNIIQGFSGFFGAPGGVLK